MMDDTIETNTGHGLTIGDTVSFPVLPETRWQRFKRWIMRRPERTHETYYCTAVSSSNTFKIVKPMTDVEQKIADLDAKMAKAKADDLTAAWQLHRRRCLKIASRIGTNPDNIIETAERLGNYILNGMPIPPKIDE